MGAQAPPYRKSHHPWRIQVMRTTRGRAAPNGRRQRKSASLRAQEIQRARRVRLRRVPHAATRLISAPLIGAQIEQILAADFGTIDAGAAADDRQPLAQRSLPCLRDREQRLRAQSKECRAKYKPPSPGEVAIEIPQIPHLKEECESFLYEAKNYLRDVLMLVNLLWGMQYQDASEWVKGKSGRPSVQELIISKFGGNHVNAIFIRQYRACIEQFPLMRDGAEHPQSQQLVIKNVTREGTVLKEATWSLEKNGTILYEPLQIIEDMTRAVENLLILAEDVLVMWVQANLVAPQLTEVRFVPEERHNAQNPVKYRVQPNDAAMQNVGRRTR